MAIKKVIRKVKNLTTNVVGKISSRICNSIEIPDEEFLRKVWSMEHKFHNLEETQRYYCEKKKPVLFIHHSKKERVIECLQRHFPKIPDKIVSKADEICRHTFNLLGSGPKEVDYEVKSIKSNKQKLVNYKALLNAHNYQSIDWHKDFKSGYRWNPKTYYKEIKYGHNEGVDIKVPWELSRFQHLPTLGKAYWVTNNERYAQEFVAQITDWIENNPPRFGVNWTCPMDVAIRVINWICGFYFFKISSEISNEFLSKFLRSLLIHGRHIRTNLEQDWGKINSNHYLSDIAGLIYLGVMFPEFKEAKRWRDFGLKELVSEMDKQVYPDGVDYECSISYHRMVLELFLSSTLLCLNNPNMFEEKIPNITDPNSENHQEAACPAWCPFPNWYMKRLEKMIEFVACYTKPDGTAPQIGDNDDGRLHILSDYGSWNRLDHRYLLSIGAVLFKRPDFAKAAGQFHEESFWLLGEEGSIAFQKLLKTNNSVAQRLNNSSSISRSLESRSFDSGGFYIMREKDNYMIVDCTPCNLKAPSGHRHNSRLSFELYAGDKSFIIDPGAYIYTASPQWRNLFRSTAYHNTIVVDGQEQNNLNREDMFWLGYEAKVKANRWETNKEYDFLDVQHKGYERLKNPVIHRRQITFNKKEGFWTIKDILTGQGNHTFDIYFHFAPMEVIADKIDNLAVFTNYKNGMNLLIKPQPIKGLNLAIQEGWISYSYGTKQKAPVVKYSLTAEVPVSFTFLVYPFKGILPNADIILERQVKNGQP